MNYEYYIMGGCIVLVVGCVMHRYKLRVNYNRTTGWQVSMMNLSLNLSPRENQQPPEPAEQKVSGE